MGSAASGRSTKGEAKIATMEKRRQVLKSALVMTVIAGAATARVGTGSQKLAASRFSCEKKRSDTPIRRRESKFCSCFGGPRAANALLAGRQYSARWLDCERVGKGVPSSIRPHRSIFNIFNECESIRAFHSNSVSAVQGQNSARVWKLCHAAIGNNARISS